jgi:hypothetical protein
MSRETAPRRRKFQRGRVARSPAALGYIGRQVVWTAWVAGVAAREVNEYRRTPAISLAIAKEYGSPTLIADFDTTWRNERRPFGDTVTVAGTVSDVDLGFRRVYVTSARLLDR